MENKEFKSFFKKVDGNEGNRCHYSTRLDTYGCGCEHNCQYCYAKSLLDFRGLWNPVNPSVAPIERIRRVIDKKLDRGGIVRLGGMTDCFQPLEKDCHITYETIKALNEKGVGYLIVTKNDLIATEEYLSILNPELAHIQVSVTSTDENLSKKIEPGAPVPEQRIKAIETLYRNGFDVSIRLSPYIPEFIDINRINSIECNKILVEFLRVNTWIERWLKNLRVNVDLSQYSLYSSGYKHLPLEKKIDLVSEVVDFDEISVCEDVEEHWWFWQKNLNHNPEDCCNLRLK